MKKLFSLAIILVSLICLCGFGEKPRVNVKDFEDLKSQVNKQDQVIAGQKAEIAGQKAEIAGQKAEIAGLKKDIILAGELEDQILECIDDSMLEAQEARAIAENHELMIDQVRDILNEGIE